MRKSSAINFNWEYVPYYDESVFTKDASAFQAIELPHTNKEFPLQYGNEQDYQFISTYRKQLTLTKPQADEAVWLHFEGVQVHCDVYLDTHLIGCHTGGYDAFDVDLTSHILEDKDYQLVVVVDSRELEHVPPFGHVVDYLTYGGIYREVQLVYAPKQRIDDVFVKTLWNDGWVLEYDLTLTQLAANQSIEVELVDEQSNWVSERTLLAATKQTLRLQLSDIVAWDIDNPHLYQARFCLYQDEQVVDVWEEQIGFRTVNFQADGFYLNGKHLKLRGLNRHQSYPYVGYAMPKSMQEQDAKILKETLGCNIVRTSHYPQSKHFLRACDRLGLLVFTEIVGWQHISKDERWRELVLTSTQNMILQYRNHPSIIIWGVRINESQDDHELYTKTNALAKELDPTRATGGVRFIKNSELLEDVYTYNDFSHRGDNAGLETRAAVTKTKDRAYLVTEYNGHMFPTKRFDDEAHRRDHALRHANVLASMYSDTSISGCIGWCMNDYNTHQDFGSGDRICYHGVLDMFRMPKLAASVYASQQDKLPVMELSSTMNIGEHAAGELGVIYAFSNMDAIRVYKNDTYIQTFYPDQSKYKDMPHPPIVIDDLIGDLIKDNESYTPAIAAKIKEVLLAIAKYGLPSLPLKFKLKMLRLMSFHGLTMDDGMQLYGKYIGNWGQKAIQYRFEGIQNEQVVCVKQRAMVNQMELVLTTSSDTLIPEHTYDVVQCFVEAKDQDGNLLPYAMGALEIEVSGDIALIGPSMITLVGGAASFYVKSLKHTGAGSVRVTCLQQSKTCNLHVKGK
ncbi:MAG: glycoside hydrolase family 2 TIM barrel-domain containing protein [Erysipelotrichaceae bacterium]